MEIDQSRKVESSRVESSRCAREARMIARDSVTSAYGKMSALWRGSLAGTRRRRKHVWCAVGCLHQVTYVKQTLYKDLDATSGALSILVALYLGSRSRTENKKECGGEKVERRRKRTLRLRERPKILLLSELFTSLLYNSCDSARFDANRRRTRGQACYASMLRADNNAR